MVLLEYFSIEIKVERLMQMNIRGAEATQLMAVEHLMKMGCLMGAMRLMKLKV